MDVPSYRQLPKVGQSAQRCAWGVFGDEDVLGRLNLVSDLDVANAMLSVRTGRPISLNWSILQPSPGILNRTPAQHHVIRVTDGWDDYLDGFFPQGSSQWDALCHCRHPELGYYGGRHSQAELDGAVDVRRELGIHNVAQRALAGRFVLADVAGFSGFDRWDPFAGHGIDRELLEHVLQEQRAQLQPGDFLLVRTGWIEAYEALTPVQRQALAERPLVASGLERETDLLEFLWDSGVAAIASDNPTLEKAPIDVNEPTGFLHYELIPLLGFLLGELFALGDLANECRREGKWAGLLVSAPLNLLGGVGSPANAVAFV